MYLKHCGYGFTFAYFCVFRCQQHNLQGRTAKILALVPVQHAPSDTSDRSDNNSDNELADDHNSSIASSSPPSLSSSLERMHILTSSESSDGDSQHNQPNDTEDDDQTESYPSEALQLNPVLREICPATPTREPNYENIPSLSCIPSLPSVAPLPTPVISIRRKTKQKDKIKEQRRFRNLRLPISDKKAPTSTSSHDSRNLRRRN